MRTLERPKTARDRPRTPHLSHSRINRYLQCPEQYRLYYIENLRPLRPAANLVFGQSIHEALAAFFARHEDPLERFIESWDEARDAELNYSGRDTWDKLRLTGQELLERFLREAVPQIARVTKVEEPFELNITSLDIPLIGVIDLVADVKHSLTVVDFKTSGSSYAEHEAQLSDQLTAYLMAEPEATRAALCVLVKRKEPAIEWHMTSRTGAQIAEYLEKSRLVAKEIASGHFFKRPGKWCAWCDYLPVCLGDARKAEETLITLP